MFSRSLASFALIATFIASTQATCMHGTTLMRRQEGEEIPVPVFSYSGETGPTNWAGLNEDFKACRTSQQQSPLDLTDVISFTETKPQIHWPNVDKAPFENLYTTLEVIVEGGLQFNNVTYTLKQFHFHTTSEHRINNEHYPLEAHFVSQAEDESILVTAVLFDLTEDGATTELLTSVTQNIAAVSEGGSKTETGPLNFAPIIEAVSTKMLYHYTGSLTTPPCKEGVQFLVVAEPLPLDVKTYKAIKKVIGFNARPTQNNPGGENLLEIAKDKAVEEDGEGASSGNGSGPVLGGDIDLNALIAAITASGAEVRVNTNSSTTIQVVKPPTDEEPPVEDPTETGEEPTETSTDTTTETETSSEGEQPTDVPEEPTTETESTDADVPEETGGVNQAPGPVAPLRRSNFRRRL